MLIKRFTCLSVRQLNLAARTFRVHFFAHLEKSLFAVTEWTVEMRLASSLGETVEPDSLCAGQQIRGRKQAVF